MRTAACILGLLLSAALAACGDDGTAPPADDFAGVWNATEVELVSVADPGVSVELIGLGATATLTLTAAKTFTLAVIVPADDDLTAAGTWSASADVFTMTFTSGLGGNWQFDYTLSGDLLALEGAHTEYDFDDDQQDDEARLNLLLERQ